MARLQIEVITAERVTFTGEADAVIAPSVLGEVGILPNHAPLMAILNPGETRIVEGGAEQLLALGGGYLEVLDNKVTILADAAEYSEEIDVERARQAMERARQAVEHRGEAVDMEKAVAAMRRAQVRLRVAERRRGPRRGAGPQGQAGGGAP